MSFEAFELSSAIKHNLSVLGSCADAGLACGPPAMTARSDWRPIPFRISTDGQAVRELAV